MQPPVLLCKPMVLHHKTNPQCHHYVKQKHQWWNCLRHPRRWNHFTNFKKIAQRLSLSTCFLQGLWMFLHIIVNLNRTLDIPVILAALCLAIYGSTNSHTFLWPWSDESFAWVSIQRACNWEGKRPKASLLPHHSGDKTNSSNAKRLPCAIPQSAELSLPLELPNLSRSSVPTWCFFG